MTKIFEKKYWLFFLLFPFFNPYGIKFIPSLTTVYDVIQIWKLISCCSIIFLYLYRGKISKFVIWIIIFELVVISTSLINGVFDSKVFTNALIAISLTMITELAVFNNIVKYYRSILKIFLSLIIINFVLCVFYPSGLRYATLYTNKKNPVYFLGIDNGIVSNLIVFIFLLSILVMLDKDLKVRGKKDSIFIIGCILTVGTIYIVGSATGLSIVLIDISVTILFSQILKRRIPYKIALVIYFSFFLFIVIMQSNIYVVNMVSNLLGKSVTFTGRSILWEAALHKIAMRPFLGYGYTAGNISIWGGQFSSHNMFLEMAIQGGLVYVIVFLIITIKSIRQLYKSPVILGNTLFLGIYCFLIKGLMESSIYQFYFVLLTMSYYSKHINIQFEKDGYYD